MKTKTLTLEEFKTLAKDKEFKEKITTPNDIIDLDNGTMIIHRANLNKYLEKYICKDEDDLSDTLYYSYGIYLTIID
jgi:hypothetical protein